MSLADPQSITVSGVTTPLPRTNVEGDETTYSSADGLLNFSVSHSESGKGRKRKSIRVDASKVTTDPFKPAENVEVSTSIYVVFDIPPAGYTNTELMALWTGFRTVLAATTDLIPSKVLAGES
jgi:hypothetical protein